MSTRNCYPVLIVWAATARGGKGRSHTSNIVPARLAESVWCKKKLHSPLYFLLSGFEPSLLLIYFSDSLNGCSHCTKVWQKTYPLCDVPFSRSAMRSFTPAQKSRRNHQIRHDFRGDAKAIRYCTNIQRRLREQAKSNKFQTKQKPCTCIKLLCASLSSYSVNRIHLRPL